MKTLSCPVDSIEYYNHDTRRIFLKIPEGESVDFKAGQYLQMILPTNKKCPFSIASAPSLEGMVEIHIRPTPGSEDSKIIETLLDEAKVIDLELPLGDCFLEKAPAGPLLMLAASTGITQMKSIIESILPGGLEHPVHLYWGVLADKDLYLSDLCKSWEEKDKNFHFVPVVSEPETSPDWQGKTGLVGNIALDDLGDVSDTTVFVSGSPGMVYATLDLYVENGLPEKNMFSDIFSYAPRAK
ncbi:MAG: NAD(P)H-flavin reductase [Pseudomonadales bacterium]|nr:NAD(P)H-flavin reductase [Pseudomonadales bacterium]